MSHAANKGKQAAIRSLLPHYQQALKVLFHYNFRLLRQGARKPRWLKANELHEILPETALSQRWLKSTSNHANQIFQAYLAAIEQQIRSLITNSSLDNEIKYTLYRANKHHGWYSKEFTSKLLRNMFKTALHRTSMPNLDKQPTMLLDGDLVGRVEQAKGGQYDYWLRIATLTPRKPVLIPLQSNRYFENKPGKTANFVQIQVLPNKLKFSLVKHAPQVARQTDGNVLGVDWGLANLFTDSQGNRYGQALYPWLQEIDVQLEALTKQLQKQGVSLKTNRRYQAFQHRIREYVKNEVNRTLNVLAIRASTLVVEKLDFRHGGLSKRMNRLLSRFGRGAVKQKLITLLEEQSIQSLEVNAAYTSQECSGCGYVDKKNRLSQDKFKCLFCGKKLHADVNGAKVVEKRFLDDNIFAYTKRATIKQTLDRIHRQRWNLPLPASISTA